MEALAAGEIFLFEGFRLDRRGLFQQDERGVFVPVAIGSRAFELLRVLVEADGFLVSKDEVMAAVWPETVVEDNNLTVQMSTLRRILDHGRPERSIIQTVAGRGYQFTRVVRRRSGPSQAPMDQGVMDVATAAAPRLLIVVLPFISLSDDREQQYFADGITEDLTTDLSRI